MNADNVKYTEWKVDKKVIKNDSYSQIRMRFPK